MKRTLFILMIAFMSINAMAQYKPIDIKGSRVFVENQKLDKIAAAECFTSINGVDRSLDYLKYRKKYKTGVGLTIGGASLAVAGSALTFTGFVNALSKGLAGENAVGAEVVMYLGLTSVIAGTTCFVVGIPMTCVNKSRLNRLEKEYNASLQFSASANGFSMALCF